jgi:hypothetical protein
MEHDIVSANLRFHRKAHSLKPSARVGVVASRMCGETLDGTHTYRPSPYASTTAVVNGFAICTREVLHIGKHRNGKVEWGGKSGYKGTGKSRRGH